MAQHNQFVIHNDLSKALTLNIEPYGAFFALPKGEEVSVKEVFTAAPVTVTLTSSDEDGLIVSIWPGDGTVTVAKDGVDVLELIQKEDRLKKVRKRRSAS